MVRSVLSNGASSWRKNVQHLSQYQASWAVGESNHPVRDRRVLVVDQDDVFTRKCATRLKRVGFPNVATAAAVGHATAHGDIQDADAVIMTMPDTVSFKEIFSILQVAKFRGFSGKLVFTADAVRSRDLYTAAVLGISDFWIKGKELDIAEEVTRLVERKPHANREYLCPKSIADLGLFRSAGLTRTEIGMIEAMADGFPRQRDIASNSRLSSVYVNKVFSRIYEKLTPVLDVGNPAQLAFLITICASFV